jgi:hypothetical protein
MGHKQTHKEQGTSPFLKKQFCFLKKGREHLRRKTDGDARAKAQFQTPGVAGFGNQRPLEFGEKTTDDSATG